jgi:hypothetical protein
MAPELSSNGRRRGGSFLLSFQAISERAVLSIALALPPPERHVLSKAFPNISDQDKGRRRFPWRCKLMT